MLFPLPYPSTNSLICRVVRFTLRQFQPSCEQMLVVRVFTRLKILSTFQGLASRQYLTNNLAKTSDGDSGSSALTGSSGSLLVCPLSRLLPRQEREAGSGTPYCSFSTSTKILTMSDGSILLPWSTTIEARSSLCSQISFILANISPTQYLTTSPSWGSPMAALPKSMPTCWQTLLSVRWLPCTNNLIVLCCCSLRSAVSTARMGTWLVTVLPCSQHLAWKIGYSYRNDRADYFEIRQQRLQAHIDLIDFISKASASGSPMKRMCLRWPIKLRRSLGLTDSLSSRRELAKRGSPWFWDCSTTRSLGFLSRAQRVEMRGAKRSLLHPTSSSSMKQRCISLMAPAQLQTPIVILSTIYPPYVTMSMDPKTAQSTSYFN